MRPMRLTVLTELSPESTPVIMPKIKKPAKLGDIVGVPSQEQGRFYAACVVAKNWVGTAFGFFRGTFQPTELSQLRHAAFLPQPIYSGEHCLVSRKWLILGHDESLLQLFPQDPEIFHRPSEQAPYGKAETASGKLRILGKEEASRIGLLDGSYRQSYTCDFLTTRLDHLLK